MRYLYTVLLTGFVIFADSITKILFYDQAVWAGQFFFSPHFNTGIARSLQVPSLLVGGITILASILIVYRYYTRQLTWWIAAILLGGIIGNAYDRLFLGGVRDFISLGDFPVFNLADVAINIGVFFLVVQLLYPCKNKTKN